MLKSFGIKNRILLLTLLPTSLLALLLGGYFTALQLSGLRTELLQRGQMITEQLAPLAAPALARNNIRLLAKIARQCLDQPDVRTITFLRPDRTPLTHAGPSILTTLPPATGNNNVVIRNGEETSLFLLPIFEHHRSMTGDQPADDGEGLLGWVEVEVSHQGILLRGYRSFMASLALIGAGLLGAALLAWYMAHAINQPLRRIQHSVAQISDGHLETRLPPLGSREFDGMAAGINRMAASLQNANEELHTSIEQATEDVRQNLETIEIQNIELDLARKEALESSRIKSEFLANMSHEIRTPLNGILGFTNLLQKSQLSARQQDYLDTIETSADSLLSIINEILDFSKIEAGKLVLENIPFNLRDLLQEALTILAPTAHAKQLELLSLVYHDTPLSLMGDPLRLKQVLTNLLSNAIKFTSKGTIVLRAMLEDEREGRVQLRISVQDTGIGLSDDDLRLLFQAFSQANNSLSRQAGGTGLGLVISKRLIEQMGGEIGVASTPGEGSEFWISLNLLRARDDAGDLPRAPLAGQRVAILESHELARKALQHQLEECGLQVEPCTSLENLLEVVAAQLPTSTPICLAVLGVTAQESSPERLHQRILDLQSLNCKSLVLCPTTEQTLYHECLTDTHNLLQAKPACTRKMQRALAELIGPQPHSDNLKNKIKRAPQLLCVDDNSANLLLVQTLLSDMGAEVTAVDSGYAALQMVQEKTFDLIFMDVQMPGMDGRQTTEAIRQWHASLGLVSAPIVALTAHAMANEKRSLLQAGLDDYLSKPINERQLAQVVLKWTGLPLRNQAPERHSAIPQNPDLAVLDAEEGLHLAAGKADLAADLLVMLVAGLPADRLAIRQAREHGERLALIERIHRLHGATHYCGVPQLRAACKRSESLLKQDNPAAEAALDELEAAMAALTQETTLSS